MRSNNLLLSLLNNSSANPRSTSLMHKDNYSNPYTSTGRSNSVCKVQAAKRQPKTLSAENNMRLVKLVHFLNLKVKNQYYFIFCKLQQILKNHRKNKKQEVKISQNLTIPQQNLTKQKSLIKSKSKVPKRQHDITLSLNRLCDSFNTFKSKRQIFLQKQLTHTAFFEILDFSKKRNAIIDLQDLLIKLIIKKERQVLDTFAKIQKQRIRNQIFMLNMNQIVAKYQNQSFQKIRTFSKTGYLQNIYTKTIVPEVKNEFFSQIQQTQPKTQEEQSNKYQNSQKTTRSKKIILRDRKIPTSQPIALTTNKSKIQLTQQKSLNCQINTRLQEKMSRCHNLKTDIIKTCQPDLSDNCLLFREIEWPLFQPKVVYTMQNYYTEFKEPSDLECLTDRSAKYTQPQLSKSMKNTPKYCKDKSSINLAIKKQVNLVNPNQSPLAKINQILNKIQQRKTYRSTQKSSEKRMVNVNIDKKFQLDQQSAIKYRTKTPNKYFEESQKQNIRERLVTQKQKPVKKVKGLQSGCKYRSTMLAKSKEPKTEFTAKKMKMEIQNIINRRNKQLYYRSESTQLN